MIERTWSAAALVMLAAVGLPAQGQVTAGQKIDAAVEIGPMYNGDGRTKIGEYVGQPVLIDFWGTH